MGKERWVLGVWRKTVEGRRGQRKLRGNPRTASIFG